MDRKSITNLGSVIEINPASISKHYPYDEIEYIDISSVSTGSFSGSTRMSLAEAPSRAKRLVKHGDTILATVRPNLRSFLFIKNPPENMVVSTGFAVLRPSNKIDARFLYYTVTDPKFTDYLTNNAKGSAYPAVDAETFARAEIWLPDLQVQQKIAAILSAYDDLIENNLRRIKILEEMAQFIYREWFVKFRFPGHHKVKMVDSPLGKIPEGWEVKRLGEVVELAYGKGLKEQNRIAGDVPVYGSSGVVGYHNQSLVEGPGIIVGRKGNVGSVHWTDIPFFPIDTVFYVITKLPLQYVYFNFKTQNFISGDAAVPGLNRNQAYSLPFILPTPEVLRIFCQTIDPIFNLLNLFKRKNDVLRQTRDLLLPKLISGEMDVSDLDIKTGINSSSPLRGKVGMGGMNKIRARELRKNMTEAERLLWRQLRLRQFGGHKFRRQQPIGRYIADFVCLEKKLIVEVDGGHHSEQVAYDQERDAWLEKQGFLILRFWDNEVLKQIESVKEVIMKALEECSNTPHLNPPPQETVSQTQVNGEEAARFQRFRMRVF